MDALDGILLAVAVLAAVGGYRAGFFTRVLSWVGLAAGVYLAARYLPRIVSLLALSSATGRLAVAAAVLVGAAFVGQAAGILVGGRLHGVLPLGPLRSFDKLVGGAVGVVGVATALWLLLPSISSVPGWPSSAARHSSIARWFSGSLPPPPNALEALRRLVADDGLPQVFASLHAGGAVGRPPASSPLPAALLARVEASTVKVQGQACNRIQDGSGFAVAPDLVLTNAHVVAGEPAGATSVLLPDGSTLPASVVMYDPNRDLALLRVPGLGERPLPLATAHVGGRGDVLGHPGGAIHLAVSPYVVSQEITAVGEDLYDRHRTRRDVFVLGAALAPGDSGGPLVDVHGRVVGVAFAIAVGQAGTAYALTTHEIRPDLVGTHRGTVATGACITG